MQIYEKIANFTIKLTSFLVCLTYLRKTTHVQSLDFQLKNHYIINSLRREKN